MRNTLIVFLGMTRVFWKLRFQFTYLDFLVRRSAFGAKLRLNENKTETGTFLRLSASTFLAIFVTVSFAAITQSLDSLFDDLYKRTGLTILNDTYSTLLATIAGMGGVFIGLYYAATIAISGAIYARVPNNIRDLLAKERVGNVYMRFLALLTYSSVILLSMKAAGFAPNKLAAILVLLGAGISVIAFVKLGARAFYLFDPTSLASELVEQIRRSYVLVGPRQFRWLDPSFQSHAYQTARLALDTVETLTEITGKEGRLSGQPYVTLCQHLLLLLGDYNSSKKKIPTDSRWYPRQYTHADWYQTDDSSTSLTYQGTGRLDPKEVSDTQWLESSILSITHSCLAKNVSDSRYDLASLLIRRIDSYARSLATAHEVDIAFNVLNDLTTKCADTLFSKKLENTEFESLEVIALADAMASIPITIFLAYAEAVIRDSCAVLAANMKAINWKSRSGIYERGLPRHLLVQLEWSYPRVNFEYRSESFRISPDWYLFELVRRSSSENLKVALNVLIMTAQEMFDKWLALATTNELYWVKATIINRETEYWAKVEYQFYRLRQHWNELSADRRIDDLPWPKIDFKLLEDSKTRRSNFLLKLMAEEATRLGAVTRPNSFPDFAGQFLHAVGEKLLASLIGNDADMVDESFGYFFASSLMQYDQLRAKANFDDWRGLAAIKVAIAPILDLMSLSGYGLLLAEVHENPRLSGTIARVWNEYLDRSKGSGQNMLGLLTSAISITDTAFEIAHRSLIRTAWGLSVSQELRKIKRRNIRDRGQFFSDRSVADHKSPLVRVLAEDEYGTFYDGIDVFIEMLVRKRDDGANFASKARRCDLGEAIAREEQRMSRAAVDLDSAHEPENNHD